MIPGDQASAMVSIAVEPAEAFRIFTEQIETWWRRGPRFRNAPGDRGFIRMEPGVGGRVFESFDDRVIEVGRATVWDPPRRLVFEWRASNFAPAEKTEVEVRFEPSASGNARHRDPSRLGGAAARSPGAPRDGACRSSRA
jgi:uncharacterized protein YndB with AHSA1/START domain